MKLSAENPEDSLYIRVMEFASRYPHGFTYNFIVESKELNLKDWEKNIIGRHLQYAGIRYNLADTTKGETIFLFIHWDPNKITSEDNKFILTFEAEFAFIDYKELKFARETSKEARKFSKVAIGISLAAFLVSILVPIFIAEYFTQTVELDNSQLELLQEFINQKDKQ